MSTGDQFPNSIISGPKGDQFPNIVDLTNINHLNTNPWINQQLQFISGISAILTDH